MIRPCTCRRESHAGAKAKLHRHTGGCAPVAAKTGNPLHPCHGAGVRLQGQGGIADGRRQAKASAAATPTFWEAAEAYIAERRPGWKNAKHADQWTNTLDTYAKPFIGSKRVDRIETEDVLAVLRPIWATKTETATRVRQRVECILDAVTVQKHRSGDNPARWKGHLAMILPKPTTVTKVENFPSLPYGEMAEFMGELRKRVAESARALEFTILTAARTDLTTGAVPAELDAKCLNWAVPGDRMKAKKEHVVPLSQAAQELAEHRRGRALLFPNDATGEQLSENAMLALLNRMGYGHVTVHGFRTTFKTWADEVGEYPRRPLRGGAGSRDQGQVQGGLQARDDAGAPAGDDGGQGQVLRVLIDLQILGPPAVLRWVCSFLVR